MNLRLTVAVTLASWALGSSACVLGPREVPVEDAAEQTAQEYCEQMFDCPCDGGRLYGDRGTCKTQVRDRLEVMREQADEAGLLYDPTCIGDFLATIADNACSSVSAPSGACVPPCNPFYGDRQVGQTCQFTGSSHDCAKGLDCSGICWSRCGPRAERGQSCSDQPCGDGLFCDDDQFCSALPELGAPCPRDRCIEGAFCGVAASGGSPQCLPYRALGEECTGHAECVSAYCPLGRCREVPRVGESCPAGVCAGGLRCQDEVCVEADPAICDLGTPW